MTIILTTLILLLFMACYVLAARMYILNRHIWERIKTLDPELWEYFGKPNGLKFKSVQVIKTKAEQQDFFRQKKYQRYQDKKLENLIKSLNNIAISLCLSVFSLLGLMWVALEYKP